MTAIDTAASAAGARAILSAGTDIEEREGRLAAGADDLAGARTTLLDGRNVLVIVAGALMSLGLTAIILAWIGASHSTIIEEQVPYLISGGLLGVALAVVGAVTYFAHWLTILVRESRQQEAARAADHAELIDALRSLQATTVTGGRVDGTARSQRGERPVRRAQGG